MFACLCVLLFCLPAFCEVMLPRLFCDGMVFQRDAPVSIWGWADPGEKISVSFNNHTYYAVTNDQGKWAVMLASAKAGGPYTMEINHAVLKNILIGDVWVCSGQSNMVLPMERVKYKYPNVIAHAENNSIRQFFVPNQYVFTAPQDDLPSGNWESATPETVLHFTATGYFFARALFERYHVPIGLVNASVGGSPVQSWLSEAALQSFPQYLAIAEKFRDNHYIDSIRNAEHAVSSAWYNNIWQSDKGFHEDKKWFDTAYDAGGWAVMHVPDYWDHSIGNGVVWFRKEINIPSDMAGQPARLLLGRIVDQDSVYLNGVFTGTTGYQYPPRIYTVQAGLLRPGKNIITVRIINSSGRGGFIRDKPYQLVAGSHTIDLEGEWQYKPGASASPLPPTTFFQYQPLGLFNGMIAPLLNYSIKGAIWYQGESNVSQPGEYKDLFIALIDDWRKKWNQGNFPFLYVQLPNYGEAKDQPAESNTARLREAQLKTLAVPNTGMAVTIDIGEWNDIHPLNKEDVGKRLAVAAQKIAYGDNTMVYSGPVYQSMRIDGNKIILSFTDTGSGLMAKDNGELKYFAIAGADKKFVWAKARIEGNKVVVWNDGIAQPVAVRYAWADNPQGADLYNKEGLPASPFRTDDW